MIKKMLSMVMVLVFVCACAGQGGLPPMPKDALEIGADLVIESINDQTGDVTILYTLSLKNISDEPLEKVILKDFNLPGEIIMEKEYFELSNVQPGEKKLVEFRVVVTGWGLNPKDQQWEVPFTIRLEKGSAYTEQDVFYYRIHLYP